MWRNHPHQQGSILFKILTRWMDSFAYDKSSITNSHFTTVSKGIWTLSLRSEDQALTIKSTPHGQSLLRLYLSDQCPKQNLSDVLLFYVIIISLFRFIIKFHLADLYVSFLVLIRRKCCAEFVLRERLVLYYSHVDIVSFASKNNIKICGIQWYNWLHFIHSLSLC